MTKNSKRKSLFTLILLCLLLHHLMHLHTVDMPNNSHGHSAFEFSIPPSLLNCTGYNSERTNNYPVLIKKTIVGNLNFNDLSYSILNARIKDTAIERLMKVSKLSVLKLICILRI